MRIATFENLTFLDISFAKNVTDEGLLHFRDKSLPISKLFVSGLTSISAIGLNDLIGCCKDSLRILEASLMN